MIGRFLYVTFLIMMNIVTKINSFHVSISTIRRKSPICISKRFNMNVDMRSTDESKFELSKYDKNQLIQQTNAWCGLNGLLYSEGDVKWTMAPVAVVPNLFSTSSYEYAVKVQPIINELIDKISRDKEFIFMNLLSVATTDSFVKRLLGMLCIRSGIDIVLC